MIPQLETWPQVGQPKVNLIWKSVLVETLFLCTIIPRLVKSTFLCGVHEMSVPIYIYQNNLDDTLMEYLYMNIHKKCI